MSEVRREQIKFSAAYLNGAAVGLFVVGGVPPLFAFVRGAIQTAASVTAFSVLCLAASIGLHLIARVLIGRLEGPHE